MKNHIAIIGMVGRFPGADNIDELWDNLCAGAESVTFFADDELDPSIESTLKKNPNYVRARGVLNGAEEFDARFFGMSPRQAQLMDPQQRVFLEASWEALENAGYEPDAFDGSIGVFAGMGNAGQSYYINNVLSNPDMVHTVGEFQTFLLNEKDYLATRVSYKLNLKGPSLNINTACSTSLVAVCQAFYALKSHQCDMALAGGICIMCPQNSGYLYEQGNILSSDGHCRPFDARAHGTVFGSGVGVVVLKRLDDALKDGDHIYAVIRGVGTNNDGSDKMSYTAPSAEGQAKAIEMALANAKVDAETISYVETHGTGTLLGDPIEIAGLTQAFRSQTDAMGFCAIGSIKSNIGHLDTAAGIASFIKTVLALKYQMLPPSINFSEPNPKIDFASSPFYVNDRLTHWQTNHLPRRAGVSSFGVGGTNAHVILEEAPALDVPQKISSHHLMVLSARTEAALDSAMRNLCQHLEQHPELNLADTAYTLQVGRKDFTCRKIAVCRDLEDAVGVLRDRDSKRLIDSRQQALNREIGFIFSGQGSQYPNMGRGLYKTQPVFAKHVDNCSEILKRHLPFDLREVLFTGEKNIKASARKLQQTFVAQPALFVIEYALAKLWATWGVNPSALVGHSIGEYTAACLAGVFSLEDALKLVAARGRLMGGLPEGSMLAVFLSDKEIQPFLTVNLSLAAINASSLCVVSGETEAVEDLENRLTTQRVISRRLHTSHAFHSKMMEPILDEFTQEVKEINMKPPQIPFVSNVTGTWIKYEEATNPKYWARHLRQTVRFSSCIAELLNEPDRVLLEVGPGNTFSSLAGQHPDRTMNQMVLSSMSHPKEQKSETSQILETLGGLWLAGVKVFWPGFYGSQKCLRLPLPTYPFERKRYWIEAAERKKSDRPEVSQPPEKKNLAVPVDAVPEEPKINNEERSDLNHAEQKIITIWHELLGVEQISTKDNFFDLGGSSLSAVRLFAQIEKIFNRNLPVATIFQAPTIEQLCAVIHHNEDSDSTSTLVSIKEGGTRLPFYCVHGAGGHVIEFYPLGRHLSANQPLYGIQDRGLNGNLSGEIKIEDMADYYIQEIRSVQPVGPYFIGGYCFGGTVAFEMARQLKALGEEVAALVIISGLCPIQNDEPPWMKGPLFQRACYYVAGKIMVEMSNLSILDRKEKFGYMWSRVRRVVEKMQAKIEMMADPVLTRLNLRNGYSFNYIVEYLMKYNVKALYEYTPGMYRGRVVIFRPVEKSWEYNHDPTLGWGRYIDNEIETHAIPGCHENLVDEPWVNALAEKLEASLNKN